MKEFKSIVEAKKSTGLSYLGGVNISAKMVKNLKVSKQLTYALYLSPANTSGYEVCPYATKECKLECLATSGRNAVEIFSGLHKIENARINKTRLFFEEQDYFMQWLIAELTLCEKKANRLNLGFSVRLNCTSDIDWANIKYNNKNIFEIFPNVQFYDYTKNPNKFLNKPNNYHLTISYTGYNWNKCKELLKSGYNVAMVFNVKNETELPKEFEGYKIINGDITDARFLDTKGIIIGLIWKRIADRKAETKVLNSCFVVQPNNKNCKY